MAIEYNISNILRVAGVKPYSPQLGTAINTLLNTQNELEYQNALKAATVEISGFELNAIYDDLEQSGFDAKNQFKGLPIYMPLLLEKVDNTDDLLLESAIIEINRTKNIVTTNVQGRDTSIKEFINNGDFQISVSGLICNHTASYPIGDVRTFHKFLEAKTSIGVIHEVMNLLGIYELVITDYDLPATPYPNVQPYSFNAISEEPIELKSIG